jgi:DNA-binding NarL/FixJ family response regulator
MAPLKVLVVEDDSFTRSTLCATLEHEGFSTPGPSANAAQALGSFDKFNHDIAMLDLDLGVGPTGLELAHLLRGKKKSIGVVLLTSFQDPRLHRSNPKPLPAGAIYLVKQEISERGQLTLAINESLEFGTTRSPLSETALSSVQIETLRLLSQGKSNADIAKERFVSERAVEQTIHRIAQQLGLAPDGKNLRVSLTNHYHRMAGGKIL